MTMTRGTGIMSHVFDDYAAAKAELEDHRNGVLVSQDDGAAVAYALWKLQERGRMFVSPGDPVYEGMIIGIHSRDNDLVVNPIKTKQLTLSLIHISEPTRLLSISYAVFCLK